MDGLLGATRSIRDKLQRGDALAALDEARLVLVGFKERRPPSTLRQLVDVLAALAVLARRAGPHSAAFPGSTLLVRPPAEGTEWLGGCAEPNPALDDPAFYGVAAAPSLPALSPARGSGLALLASGSGPALPTTLAPRPRGYRCLADAVKAACDGDVIVLLAGTHPTGGTSESGIVLDKRLLIVGQGGREQVTLDHRGNHPLLRISRGAVVQGVSIECVGFASAVRFEGRWPPAGPVLPCPLLLDCSISCSGGDGVIVQGGVAPLLQGCSIQGRKYALRVMGACTGLGSTSGLFDAEGASASAPQHAAAGIRAPHAVLAGCTLSADEEVGLHVSGQACATLSGCSISGCGQEGVVALGSCAVSMQECSIERSGPGVDASGMAQVKLVGCKISCSGGLWLWGSAKCEVWGPSLISSTGPEPAVVVQSPGRARLVMHSQPPAGSSKASAVEPGGVQVVGQVCGPVVWDR